MAQPSKRKVEFMLHQEELPDYFKQLGDELASGNVAIGDAKLDVTDFSKLSLTLKKANNGVLVKMKIKYDDDNEFDSQFDINGEFCYSASDHKNLELLMTGGGNALPPKYKHLKKIMKRQFKAIRCALVSGTLPAPDLVQGFVQASEWMCSFPGKGDPFYAAYMEAVRAFAAAVAAQDTEETRVQIEKLDALKKSCHEKYK